MGTRHSQHPRAAGDFYTEPDWTVSALFHHAWPEQGLHDPCAGIGTIVDVATQYGLRATGADIADRANGRFAVRNFLTDQTVYSAVVTNPPYRLAPAIIYHGLEQVRAGGIVAALVPISFLASQRRYPLFNRIECELVLVLSRRPSMPPGELLKAHGESVRHSGSTDFAWLVWRRGGRTGNGTRIEWAVP